MCVPGFPSVCVGSKLVYPYRSVCYECIVKLTTGLHNASWTTKVDHVYSH